MFAMRKGKEVMRLSFRVILSAERNITNQVTVLVWIIAELL